MVPWRSLPFCDHFRISYRPKPLSEVRFGALFVFFRTTFGQMTSQNSELFSKKSIPYSLSGQTATRKMIVSWPSNYEVFIPNCRKPLIFQRNSNLFAGIFGKPVFHIKPSEASFPLGMSGNCFLYSENWFLDSENWLLEFGMLKYWISEDPNWHLGGF